MPDNEKQLEADIESFLISPKGGWQKATDAGYRAGIQYDSMGAFQENYALDIDTLCTFVKATQPVAWALFEKRCNLSFYAFTATPKDKTLELFGEE